MLLSNYPIDTYVNMSPEVWKSILSKAAVHYQQFVPCTKIIMMGAINPLRTNVPICPMEAMFPCCSANQLTGFYRMGTLVVKGLNKSTSERLFL